jgi:hypothetical protein
MFVQTTLFNDTAYENHQTISIKMVTGKSRVDNKWKRARERQRGAD